MKPFEFMVSESQERMLAIVTPENLEAAHAVCEKWGLRSTVIGEVTGTGRFVVREGDTVVADMPAATLAHDAPIYDPAKERPAYLDEVQSFDPMGLSHPEGREALSGTLLALLASPNICSRHWIWEQYDHQVMVNTVVLPGSDAAVLRVGDTGRGEVSNRGIAVSSDCNGRYCYLDPYVGAQIAFAEAARNVACSGGRAAAITDCLNFGNPEKPEVFWTFYESIRGLADACTAFGVPVISGNVSFYNESFGQPIYPTPTVGLVGLLEDVEDHCTMGFKQRATRSCCSAAPGPSWAAASTSRSCTAWWPAVRRRWTSWRRRAARAARTAIGTGLLRSRTTARRAGSPWRSPSAASPAASGRRALPGRTPGTALFSESQGRRRHRAGGQLQRAQDARGHARDPCMKLGTVGGASLRVGDQSM